MKKLLYLVNVDWFFISHRLDLAIAAKNQGYDVYVLGKDTGHSHIFSKNKINFVDIPVSRSGINPLKEFKLLLIILFKYKKINPDIVHHVALKSVIYGTIAARIFKIPTIINAITGLGYVFNKNDSIINSFINKIILGSLKLVSSKPFITTILQNDYHSNILIRKRILKRNNVKIICGSGVNFNVFKYLPENPSNELKVMMLSRLLWDKGVKEFVDASLLIKNNNDLKFKFVLVGKIDLNNRSAIPKSSVDTWVQNGLIEWWGEKMIEDIPSIISEGTIIVLPSYHEGLPKILLEAGAVGRPVVTTSIPGCKDVIKQNVNGLLVPVGDSYSLSKAIDYLLRNPKIRKRMGVNARNIIEKNYDLKNIVKQQLDLYLN